MLDKTEILKILRAALAKIKEFKTGSLEEFGKHIPKGVRKNSYYLKAVLKGALELIPTFGPLAVAVYEAYEKKEGDKKIAERLDQVIQEIKQNREQLLKSLPPDLKEYVKMLINSIDDIDKKLEEIKKEVKKCGFQTIEERIEETAKEENLKEDRRAFESGMTSERWTSIVNNWGIKRELADETEALINNERKSVLILGESGAGKTVLQRMIAYSFHQRGWEVYINVKTDFDEERIVDLAKSHENALIIIDGVRGLEDKIQSLLKRVSGLGKKNVQVLLAERRERFVSPQGDFLIPESILGEYSCAIKELKLTKNEIEGYLKSKGKDLSDEKIKNAVERLSSQCDKPGSFLLLLLYGATGEKDIEYFVKSIEHLVKRQCESIKEAIKEGNNLRSAVVRIFPVQAYEERYPEEAFEKHMKISREEAVKCLGTLHNMGLIVKNDDNIETFHPWICREYLKYEIENKRLDKEIILQFLSDFANALDTACNDKRDKFTEILLTIGTNLAIEALLEKAEKKREVAIEYLKKVIEASPNHVNAHNNLGILLTGFNRYDEAEKEYREEIRINPNYAGAHNNLGNVLVNLKRYDEAEKEYREEIRINPNYAGAHNNLGNVLKDLKRYDEAEKEYREAIRIDPNFAEAHYNLGFLLTGFNRYDEAGREYREAIRINPDFAEAHYNLGILCGQFGRISDSKTEILRARELFEKEGRSVYVKNCDEILEILKNLNSQL